MNCIFSGEFITLVHENTQLLAVPVLDCQWQMMRPSKALEFE
jgi:hypothetical protein